MMAYCEKGCSLIPPLPYTSIKSVFVKCTIHICLCLQSPVSRHSLDVTVEDVSQAAATVMMLIHAQMAVMKRNVVSIDINLTGECHLKQL